MKFRLTVHVLRPNGQSETIHTDLEGGSVLIGRGAACNLRYDSTLFSLEHARITLEQERFYVEDLGSLSGIRVNGRTVKRSELKKGDILQLGGVELRVEQVEPGVGLELHEERILQKTEGSEERVEAALKKLHMQRALPNMFLLSLLLGGSVAIFFALFPFGFSRNVSSLSSGPLSNPHKMIEEDCQACHGTPFQQVQDESCLSCHAMSEHAEMLLSSSDDSAGQKEWMGHKKVGRCASCHMEHNGDHGVTLNDARLCTDCHSNLQDEFPKSNLLNVNAFSEHPSFQVAVTKEDGRKKRAPIKSSRNGDATGEYARDNAKIKMNHKVHLEDNLDSPDGPVTLQCDDCHRVTPHTTTFEPIMYERDCSTCHGLQFDERIPEREVPHGDADVVYNFLYAEYAKLLLDEERAHTISGFERIKPGGDDRLEGKGVEFTRRAVETAAREAEELLFTKTACQLCHMVDELTPDTDLPERENNSRYSVIKPEIPQVWLPKAHFAHSAHLTVQCESCHEGVRDSAETTDILLPQVESCRECHGDRGADKKVQSDCVLCHSFHHPTLIEEEKKLEILDIVGGKVGS